MSAKPLSKSAARAVLAHMRECLERTRDDAKGGDPLRGAWCRLVGRMEYYGVVPEHETDDLMDFPEGYDRGK